MSMKERLSRANWELNTFFKTGRVPRHDYAMQKHNGSNQMQRGAQMAQPTQANQSIQGSKVKCDKCGSEVSPLAAFCHVCANKIKSKSSI